LKEKRQVSRSTSADIYFKVPPRFIGESMVIGGTIGAGVAIASQNYQAIALLALILTGLFILKRKYRIMK